jgi:S1-C subfamily serine protease
MAFEIAASYFDEMPSSNPGPNHTIMKKSLVISILFLNLFPATVAFSQTQDDIQRLKRSIVKIDTPTESGTGIIVGSSETEVFVLTAYHVVEAAQDIKVSFFDKRYLEFPATIHHKYEERSDFAVIRVRKKEGQESVPSDLQSLTPSALALKESTKLMILGHSRGQPWLYRPGEVISLNSDNNFEKFLLTGNIENGDSGGAVFDEKGLLLGMVTGREGLGRGSALKIGLVLQVVHEGWGIPTNLIVEKQARSILTLPLNEPQPIKVPKYILNIKEQIIKLEDLIAQEQEIEKEEDVEVMRERYDGWTYRCKLALGDVDLAQGWLLKYPTNFKARFGSIAEINVKNISKLELRKLILLKLKHSVEELKNVIAYLQK